MNEPWVEVDLARLGANVSAAMDRLGSGATLIMVVKADAYGHGIGRVVRHAAARGVGWFSVATSSEAFSVRAAAPEAGILVVGAVSPEDVPQLLERNITPTVVDLAHARALGAAARARGRILPVHLKIDTGMGRLGILWPDAVAECAEILREPGLEVRGICSHLARVEPGEGDPGSVQAARFRTVAEAIDARAGRRLFRHLSNSRALLLHPEWDFDGVRAGIALYGYGASDPRGALFTRPVLEWKCRVAQARAVPAGFPVGYCSTHVTPAPTVLATIALGYADGYLRALSNRAHVLISGRRCRLVGRVSMNWITADAGPEARIEPGDEVVLIGRQGRQSVWADELATLARTIPYEILTGIHPGHARIGVETAD